MRRYPVELEATCLGCDRFRQEVVATLVMLVSVCRDKIEIRLTITELFLK
jgi:predicted Fe-S protein YdhL (DUF1289 family)